jgi:hypothetical protein
VRGKSKTRNQHYESNCITAEILDTICFSPYVGIFLSFIPLVPPGVPLLECANAPAQRAHWAGLPMFATSFGNGTAESPPSAASADAFRAQALTSTVPHAGSSDLRPGIADHFRFEHSRDGRTRRELIAPLQTAFPTIFRPAGIARSASPFKYSSQGIPIGTTTLIENPLGYSIPPQTISVPEYGVRGFSDFQFPISAIIPPCPRN